MSQNENFNNEVADEIMESFDATIHLELDDGTEADCVVIGFFKLEETGFDYIALLPLTEDMDDEEESEVLLYRYEETDEGEPVLSNIESDEEYDLAGEAFFALWDEEDE